MSRKKIDITDKLSFEENPKLVIKGQEIEVNTDAPTVLKVMNELGDGEDVSPKAINNIYELIFNEKERKKIDKLNLKVKDFQTVVSAAISLVTGESQGE